MALGRVADKDWSYYRVLDRLMLYEQRIENSMLRTMHELKKLQIMRRIEDEAVAEQQVAQESPPAHRRRGDLKKQTQFASALMGTKSYTRKDYDDTSRCGITENKANFRSCHTPQMEKATVKSVVMT